MIGNVNVPGALAADIANKVDKIAGKGLSTEDYTTAEKTKLANIDLSNIPEASNLQFNLTSKKIIPPFSSSFNPYKLTQSRFYGGAYWAASTGIIYAKNKYWYAFANRMYYSTDLQNWSFYYLPDTMTTKGSAKLVYVNNRFYLSFSNNYYYCNDSQHYGYSYYHYTSTDGENWTKCTGIPVILYGLKNDNVWTYTERYESDNNDHTDGFYLQRDYYSYTIIYSTFYYINSTYFVLTDNNTLYSSSDGINFTKVSDKVFPDVSSGTHYYCRCSSEGWYNSSSTLSSSKIMEFSKVDDIKMVNNVIYLMIHFTIGTSTNIYPVLCKTTDGTTFTKLTGSYSYPITGGDSSEAQMFDVNNKLLIFMAASFTNTASGYHSVRGATKIALYDGSSFTYSNLVTSGEFHLVNIYYDSSDSTYKGIIEETYVLGSNDPFLTKYDTMTLSGTTYTITQSRSDNFNDIDRYIKIDGNNFYGIIIQNSKYKLYRLNWDLTKTLLQDSDIFSSISNDSSSDIVLNYRNHDIDVTYSSAGSTGVYERKFVIACSGYGTIDIDLPFMVNQYQSSSNYYYMPTPVSKWHVFVNNNILNIVYYTTYKDNSTTQRYYVYNIYCMIDFNNDNTMSLKFQDVKLLIDYDYEKFGDLLNIISLNNSILIMTANNYIFKLDENLNILKSTKLELHSTIDYVDTWNDTLIAHLSNSNIIQSKDGINWSPLSSINNNIDSNEYNMKINNNKIYIEDNWNTLYTFELDENE